MKTIRVVAVIIKATNETGEPLIFATQRTMVTLKAVGNFLVERLRKEKRHRRLLFVR